MRQINYETGVNRKMTIFSEFCETCNTLMITPELVTAHKNLRDSKKRRKDKNKVSSTVSKG